MQKNHERQKERKGQRRYKAKVPYSKAKGTQNNHKKAKNNADER